MRFQKPEILVEVAHDGSEKVGGNFVAEVFALIDGLTKRVGMVRDVVHQPFQLRRAIGGAEVRFLQSGLRRNFAGGAIGNAPRAAIRSAMESV